MACGKSPALESVSFMSDPVGSTSGKSGRSLLSIAKQPANASARPENLSLLNTPDDLPDARSKHRAARSRREARPSPLMRALAGNHNGAERPHGHDEDDQWLPEASAQPDWNSDGYQAARAWDDATDDGPAGDTQYEETNGQWRPTFDASKIVPGVIRSRYLILSTTILGAAIGAMIALSTPGTYTSAAEIQIDPRAVKVVGQDITLSGLPSDEANANVEFQQQAIGSATVIDQVIAQLDLGADPEFNGSQGAAGIGALLGELRSILSRSDPGTSARDAGRARESFYEKLRIERVGDAPVVSIAVTTQEPEKSALIANTIADVFVQSQSDPQVEKPAGVGEGMSARLAQLQREADAAERKLETYRTENGLAGPSTAPVADAGLLKLNNQLAVAKASTMEINARAATARELDLETVIANGLPEQLSSSAMTELRAQYGSARQALDRALVRLAAQHPERMAAEGRLADLRGQIGTEMRRLVSATQSELKGAVQLEQDLAGRLAREKAGQTGLNDELLVLRELELDASATRAIYENLLHRAGKTGELAGTNPASVSVVARAEPSAVSNGRSLTKLTITGLLMGLLAGLGLGVLRGLYAGFGSIRTTGPVLPVRPRPSPERHERQEEIERILSSVPGLWSGRANAPEMQWEPAELPASTHFAHAAYDEPAAPLEPPEPQPAFSASPPPVWDVAPAAVQQQPPVQPSTEKWVAGPQRPVEPQMQIAPQSQSALQLQFAPPPPVAPPQVYYASAPPIMPLWPQAMAPQYYPQPVMYQVPPPPMPQFVVAMPQASAYAPAFQTQPVAAMPGAAPTTAPSSAAPQPTTPVDEIRDSLREFRDAVRDLTQSRSRVGR